MTSTNPSSDQLTATFLARVDRFSAVVDLGPASGRTWDSPSPCADWTAAAVLHHVISTQRDFLAQRGADLGPATGVLVQAWANHRHDLRRLLADGTFGAAEYDGHFGATTVGDSLVRFYGFDLLVHGWDLAQALGRDFTLSDAEVAALNTEADGFGPALHADGICAAAVEPPAGADPQQRLLARLGRPA